MKTKALLLLMSLFCFTVLAQKPEGMVKIEVPEELSSDEAYANFVAKKAEATGLKTIPGILVKEVHKNEIITNHEIVKPLLKEFYDSAIYYKVNYGKGLVNLKRVVYIDTEDYGFMGAVSKDGSTITLNSSLLDYPNLARVILFRQLGEIYGMKKASVHSHEIMSEHWEIDDKHENLAKRLREHHVQKKKFFECLAKVKPLDKRL